MEVQVAPLLNASEVSRILNIKKSTLYDAVAKGRIPVVRLWQGSRRTLVRFRRTDIEAFIRERVTAPSRPKISAR